MDEIDSTNAELLRRARAGAPAGQVLVARHQSAGRGRHDRRWEAPAGSSLLVSVLLRPDLPPADLHLVTFAAGLAAVDACEAVAGVRLSLKWPNDVVVDGDDGARKLAGLLAESVLDGDRVAALVVGMGLNVRWAPEGGAALDELAAAPVDLDVLLDRWLAAFDLDGVADRYRRACSTLGRRVRVETTSGDVTGIAEDVDGHGHLVVATPEGRRTFTVGDVVHLRPV